MGVMQVMRSLLMAQPHRESIAGTEGIATFDDDFKGLMKLTVPFSPVQDLHGMPNPYPAGASVNLIPDGTDTGNGYVAGHYLMNGNTTIASSNYYISEFFPVDENTTYTWSNTNGTILNPAICFYDENKDFISGIAFEGVASKTFTPPEGAVYARSSQTYYTATSAAKFQLEVGSIATAYKRYSNICPIDGFSECKIINDPKHVGFVLWNQIANTVPSSWGTLRTTVSFDGTIMTIKPTTGSSLKQACKAVTAGHTFLLKGILKKETTAAGFYYGTYVYRDNSFDERYYVTTKENDVPFSHLLHPRGGYNSITFNLATTVAASQKVVLDKVQIFDLTEMFGAGNEPATVAAFNELFPNDYYEYNAGEETCISEINGDPHYDIPVAFTDPTTGNPMTVYGGTLTLNEDGSADLVAEKGAATLDGTNIAGHNQTGCVVTANNVLKEMASSDIGEYISDRFKAHINSGTTNMNNEFTVDAYGRIVIKAPSLFSNGNETEANAYFAENPTTIVGLLPSSLTYHFDNVGQLKSFIGQNNVWTDLNGNPTVGYWKHG